MRGILLSWSQVSAPSPRPLFHAQLLLAGGPHTFSTFIDSGADVTLIHEELAVQLGIDLVPLSCPLLPSALDSHLSGTVTHQTMPIHMLLVANHHKTIQFLRSPDLLLMLGYPWLHCHNPHIDWRWGPFWYEPSPVIKSASEKLLHLCLSPVLVQPLTCLRCPLNTTTFRRFSAN